MIHDFSRFLEKIELLIVGIIKPTITETIMTTKQITTGTPTAESASRTFANLTIECGLKPNLQDLLQDKDPHIDELNERTLEVVLDLEQYAVCGECGLTCYTGAEHYEAIQNGEEWLCADCDSEYEDRDESDDGYEDCEWCGENHHYEDKCRDELNAAIDASGNCFN